MIPVIDLHCDTLSKLCSSPHDFFLPSKFSRSHITLPGLRASGSLLQCFAFFTDLAECTNISPWENILRQHNCFRTLLRLSDGALRQALTYDDIFTNRNAGAISALLALEESCLSEQPVLLLPTLYSMGVRMATITWNHRTLLGSPANILSSFLPSGVLPSSGLTPVGFDFLAEAERLGILVDVSHLSDAGFFDIASHCRKPFLASHSNARSVCNVPRNLSDEMLRTLAAHGGIAGLNLHEPFLLTKQGTSEEVLTALVRHVRHIISVAGTDTPALGTDLDGIAGNAAIPDISCLSRLEHALRDAGLTTGEIEKVFYRNALRLFKECL